ncbi:MAG: hypothetical protein N2445_05595, partial [Acidobacteria bacterium]|nr:hypothetical protein [Acidobacteriota bacterium]
MFRGFFNFRSIKDQTKRKQIYSISKEAQTEKEKKRKYEQEQVDLKNKFSYRSDLLGKKIVGLKIRIDSNRSLKKGAPNLIETLKKFNANATFFVSFGKSGNGESLFSLFNPFFYREIAKSQQLKIEGFDYAFSGLLAPPKDILQNGEEILSEIKEKGFDIGSGCFSPPLWIKAVLKRDEEAISQLYNR